MSYFNKYIWVAPTRKCNKHNCSSYLKEYSPRKRGGGDPDSEFLSLLSVLYSPRKRGNPVLKHGL